MRLMVGHNHGRFTEILACGQCESDSRNPSEQETGHPLDELMVFQFAFLRIAFEEEVEESVRIGEQEHQQNIPHKSVN